MKHWTRALKRPSADIVNAHNPGKATFVLLEGTNHSLIEVGSMDAGIRLRNDQQKMYEYLQNHFNEKFIHICDEWIQKVMTE